MGWAVDRNRHYAQTGVLVLKVNIELTSHGDARETCSMVAQACPRFSSTLDMQARWKQNALELFKQMGALGRI